MKWLVCLLPVIVHARISIDIDASQTMSDSAITTSGSSKNIITPKDRANFNLDEIKLQYGVNKLTGGKRLPTNAYLSSPTPWNDLYKTYKWKEVSTIIKPFKSRVVNTKKESVILDKKETVNNGKEPIVRKVTLTAKVEDVVSSYWGKDAKIFEADMEYDIKFKGIGNVTQFNLKSTFGKGFIAREIGVVNPTTVQVSLRPNQNVTTVLTATKVRIEVGVTYMAILDGYVAVNYEDKFEGHHFWAYDVADVLKSIDNFAQNVTVTEFVVVEFYDDLRTVVYDGQQKI